MIRVSLKPLRCRFDFLARVARGGAFAALVAAALAGGAATAQDVDLSLLGTTHPGFRIDGIDALDSSGRSVSGAGDVNGDGLADLIVGALLADPGGDSNAGETYVVFGKTDGTAVDLN
ncbi:FG-GAP repeat protein, partial [Candidatus Poribacteria bacterium]|nr:FG-GAP repeat protein [Candidatus Poribacteria bacterium]